MKIVLRILVAALIAAGALHATPFRLSGMGGQFLVPDAEFDALNLNPALLTRLSGLCVVADLGLRLDSFNDVQEDYTGVHFSEPTNNTLIQNVLAFESTGTRLGVLSGGKKFNIGLILEPATTASNMFVTLDPNSTTNDAGDLQFHMFVRKGAPYNGRLLIAAGSEKAAFGFSAVVRNLPYEYRSETWTNGAEDRSARSATRNSLLDFSGDMGLTFSDNDRWSFGFDGGYALVIGLNSPASHPFAPLNYIYTNNSFYFSDRHSGSRVNAGFFLDRASGDAGLIRLCARFGMNSDLLESEADQAAIALGMTNLLHRVASQSFSMVLSLGRSVILPKGLLFWGVRIDSVRSRSMTREDDDVTAAPFFPGSEISTKIDTFSLGADLTLGAEGNILPWLTIRGALKTSLARFSTVDTRLKDYFLNPVTVQDEGAVDFTMIPGVAMTAGASLRFNSRTWFDVYTGLNFFGVDLYNDTYQKDRLVSVADPNKSNPVDTTFRLSFLLRLGLRVKI